MGSDRHCLNDIKNLEKKKINLIVTNWLSILLFIVKDVDKEIRTAVEDDEKIGCDTKVTHNIAFVYDHLCVRVLHYNSHY